jgi:hypothetical protein
MGSQELAKARFQYWRGETGEGINLTAFGIIVDERGL